MQSSSWVERIKRARSRSGLIPLRLRRRAVTDSLTTIKTATTFSLSSFHSPPRLSPRINLFRLWKRLPPSPPPNHRSLLLQLLMTNILAMTLPGLNFTSEKTSNIPLHRAYWALLDIPFDGGSLDSSSSSLYDFSGLQRRRLSAFSLDDDPPAQIRISASSLDDPPTLLVRLLSWNPLRRIPR